MQHVRLFIVCGGVSQQGLLFVFLCMYPIPNSVWPDKGGYIQGSDLGFRLGVMYVDLLGWSELRVADDANAQIMA